MRMQARLIRSAILLLALLAPAAATAQQGADPAIREVIESQLQAFRADFLRHVDGADGPDRRCPAARPPRAARRPSRWRSR